jgi:hypothetical protein
MKEVIVLDPLWSTAVAQGYYLMPEKSGLYPNRIFVRPENNSEVSEYFRTNSWGLKGEEPDQNKKQTVVWGDSTVFSLGAGWVERLNDLFPAQQFLNGGIEGDEPFNIINRMICMNRDHKIARNIFSPGWHDRTRLHGDNQKKYADSLCELDLVLSKVIKSKLIPDLVLCTLPTALNDEYLKNDIRSYFNEETDPDLAFRFWGDLDYQEITVKSINRYVNDRNELIRILARQYQIPLIDLYVLFRPKNMMESKQMFFDVCHFRPNMYDTFTALVADELKKIDQQK